MLLDSIDLYVTDLQLARQNWLLQKVEFIPSDRDILVTAPNFDIPVRVEILTTTNPTVTDDDYQDVRIVEHSELGNIRKDGELACAFYGIGPSTRLAFSFDPQSMNVRLWYEPALDPPALLTDQPRLVKAFHTMLKYATAKLCLPLVKDINPEFGAAQMKNITEQLARWERNWHLWRLSARDARLTHKTAFNHRRRTINYF